MITHETKIRVRYGEVDRMGFLYHSHYIEYFDVGRSELMRHIGLTNFDIENSGIELPVTKVDVDYIAPAIYDDLITIRTSIREIPRATIKFHYEVLRNGSGQESMEPIHIASGYVILAFMNKLTKKACRPSLKIIQTVKKYF